MNRIPLLFIFFIFLYTGNSSAQLAGTYTIGSGGDYANFNDAVTALTTSGVNGAVTFDVLSGNYSEQIVIPAISGASASNTITFHAQTDNANDVILLHNASGSGDNYVVRLDGASYITFNTLTLSALGTTYARIVEIFNGSHHITLSNSVLNGYESATTSANQYLVTGNNTLIENLTVDNCTFNEGSIGVYLQGVNGSNLSGSNVIQNTVFNSLGYYAVYTQYQNGIHLTGNEVSAGNGFYLHTSQGEMQILNNKISCYDYGLNIYSCTGGSNLVTGPGLIANNMIYTSNNYGTYIYASNYQNYYNNSINMTSGNSGTVGFYIYSGGNNNIVNNSFVHMGYGVAARIQTSASVGELDYNNYFSNGNYLVEWGNDGVYDLPDFQALSTKDAHSISVFPHYTSNSDLHTMTPWLDGKGTHLSEVAQDYDGENRDGSTPDIGADEFTPDAANTTPLAGHYTIGGSSPDYASMADAIADLLIKGVSDSVFLDFRNGNYNVQQTIYTIPGTTTDIPVVFQSETGNRDNVTLYFYATGTGDNYMVHLHGADNIHFRNLGFSGNTDNSAYSRNIALTGGVNNFKLEDCKLAGSQNSGANAALLSAQTSLYNSRLISGNSFNAGAFGVYSSGVNGNIHSMNAVISDNEFSDQRNYAIQVQYENDVLITDNVVNDPSGNGIYLHTCHGEIKVLKNTVYSRDYALNIYSCTGGNDLETGPGLIANNMFCANNNYGTYMYASNYQNYYNNSINMTSGNSGTVGFYIYSGGNNNIVNNSFVHMGYGVAARIQTSASVGELDYNNYFSNGNYLVEWGNDGVYDLPDFQALSTKDAHSISVFPHYTSNSDLHTMTPWLDGKGTHLSEVAQDYDGENRDGSTPDIGADEFTPDAANTTPLAGHYTIGGSGPDYASMADAVADLLIKGVSDSVFLDFRNGNYSFQQTIYTVPGTSKDAPVVFESESENRDNVTLYIYAEDASQNYILHLHGADFIHLRNLGFSGNTNTSQYSRNIALTGGVNHFKLEDCKLNGSQNSSANAALLSAQTSLYNSRLISGNSFNGGAFGVYSSGVNGNIRSMNAVISNNELTNQRNYALQVQYEDSISIMDNMVNAPSGNGIYMHTCHGGTKVLNNKIYSSNYGLNVYNCTGGNNLESNPGLIANNFITSGNNYSTYIYSSSNQNFYNNSINLTDGNTNSTAFYIYSGGNNNIVNNILVNSNSGFAYYVYTAASVNTSDYNDIYSNGSVVAYWGANKATLTDLQSASSKDANSISIDPQFISGTDLHIRAQGIDGAGIPLADVTTDIDGEIRDETTPDIGADEFTYGLNYAPEITSEPVMNSIVQHLYEYQVTATDNNGDELSYSLTAAPAFLGVDASGLISGTPSSGDVGDHTVVVEVTDGNGGSDTQTFTLHVELNVGLDDVNSGTPSNYMLYHNYPDPFRNTTYIKYDLPVSDYVKLEVYDINGRLIKQLVSSRQDAGSYTVPFSAETLQDGIYLYRINIGRFSAVQKMILNR
ncbi:right-handed parallel beta-helix repeat-containing protein [Saccharicrinis sp. FJH2]|uniref:right-handed parallel beta-helix repeat-containing protein n=1 Tax=Saccharicrinis sp. FJH65 TaxID=3344659 RepID=UPI0035F24D50